MRTDEELFGVFWRLADGDSSGVDSLSPGELHRLKQLVVRRMARADQAQATDRDSGRLHGLPGQVAGTLGFEPEQMEAIHRCRAKALETAERLACAASGTNPDEHEAEPGAEQAAAARIYRETFGKAYQEYFNAHIDAFLAEAVAEMQKRKDG